MIKFKITENGRIHIDKFGRVWQMLKDSYGSWNLYCFNNEYDFENSYLDLGYETWVDGGFTIKLAKNFIKKNILNYK